MPRASTLLLVFCILGFVFLYAPILSLIIFSFNESKLVTVWGGFSTKWYRALLEDPQILGAAWISLKVAVVTATLAVVLGTLAAYVLTRFGRFRCARAPDRHVDGAAGHARRDHRAVAAPALRRRWSS